MVEILYRVKEHGRIVGYWAREAVHGSEIWIPIQDVGRYKATNAKLDANGKFIANTGSRIKTIDRNDKLELNRRRTSQIGKPRLIYNTSFGDLSLTQSKLLKSFDNSNILRLDKRSINMKITMKDLSCLTADEDYGDLPGANRPARPTITEVDLDVNSGGASRF